MSCVVCASTTSSFFAWLITTGVVSLARKVVSGATFNESGVAVGAAAGVCAEVCAPTAFRAVATDARLSPQTSMTREHFTEGLHIRDQWSEIQQNYRS